MCFPEGLGDTPFWKIYEVFKIGWLSRVNSKTQMLDNTGLKIKILT